MRVLVAGRNGQVAQALAELSTAEFDVLCFGRSDFDITGETAVCRLVEQQRPAVVVNAAAYTAVDRAESEPEQAMAINRDGAANLSVAAQRAGIPIVHLSTDYVFDGAKTSPYDESDETGPINVYGESKLAGELAVAAANPAHVILRTSWVHSPWGTNFVKTMLRLGETKPEVRVVSDQFGMPNYAPDLAEAIALIIRRLLTQPPTSDAFGTFHLSAAGQTTWAGLATKIFAEAQEYGRPPVAVTEITTAEYPTPALRPANSTLAAGKLAHAFGCVLPSWQGGVAASVARLLGTPSPSD